MNLYVLRQLFSSKFTFFVPKISINVSFYLFQHSFDYFLPPWFNVLFSKTPRIGQFRMISTKKGMRQHPLNSAFSIYTSAFYYSYLNAVIGSNLAAFFAGNQPKKIPMKALTKNAINTAPTLTTNGAPITWAMT